VAKGFGCRSRLANAYSGFNDCCLHLPVFIFLFKDSSYNKGQMNFNIYYDISSYVINFRPVNTRAGSFELRLSVQEIEEFCQTNNEL
jgi:hypothetical protein